jgi:carboxylate-amine ligase
MAIPPLGAPDPEVSADARYERIVAEYGDIGRRAGTLGMHVHVDIGDDDEGVRVIDALRPWLPLVVALSANSPFAGGHDTGYASWRRQVWDRWPSAGAAEAFGSVAEYRRVSDRLIDIGAALDPGMLYFDARLAADYPTLEVRVADTCTEVEDALVVVALVRALVETLANTSTSSEPPVRSDVLRAAFWRASRYGVSADLVHPVTWGRVPAADALRALTDLVQPALHEAGDVERVDDGLARLRATGNGARRQRAAYERTGELRAVVADVVTRTRASLGG